MPFLNVNFLNVNFLNFNFLKFNFLNFSFLYAAWLSLLAVNTLLLNLDPPCAALRLHLPSPLYALVSSAPGSVNDLSYEMMASPVPSHILFSM